MCHNRMYKLKIIQTEKRYLISRHSLFTSLSLQTDTKNEQKRGSVSQSQSGIEAEIQDLWDGLRTELHSTSPCITDLISS